MAAVSIRVRMRKRVGLVLIDNLFKGAASVSRLVPMVKPSRHNVEVIKDILYRDTGMVDHRLDVYRPTTGHGPWPVVLYVHGGGFRILSKDTHWIMGLMFARRGYLVFNINYRLAPKYPYPAALEDACAAYTWVQQNAAEYGGDASRLLLAGESAGANLITSITLASCYRRPESFAAPIFEAGRVPDVVLPACGMYQVTNVERFAAGNKVPAWIMDRLIEISESYIPTGSTDTALADPLLVLENGAQPDRPLPPFFLTVGTGDPIEDDTRRLERALGKLGVDVEARYYPGQGHAFHALVFRKAARTCWQDTFEFLNARQPY
ncbi:MAG: alpha/beta hydrolase [Myxococcota bacterium]